MPSFPAGDDEKVHVTHGLTRRTRVSKMALHDYPIDGQVWSAEYGLWAVLGGRKKV